jgi:hypothetical protein
MELEQENYHDIDRINARKDNVLRLWNYLLELLRARRSRLELSLLLQHNFQVKHTLECRVDVCTVLYLGMKGLSEYCHSIWTFLSSASCSSIPSR